MVERVVFILSAVATVLSVIIGIKLKSHSSHESDSMKSDWTGDNGIIYIALAMGIIIVFQVVSMAFTAIFGGLDNSTDSSEQAHHTIPSEVYVEESIDY